MVLYRPAELACVLLAALGSASMPARCLAEEGAAIIIDHRPGATAPSGPVPGEIAGLPVLPTVSTSARAALSVAIAQMWEYWRNADFHACGEHATAARAAVESGPQHASRAQVAELAVVSAACSLGDEDVAGARQTLRDALSLALPVDRFLGAVTEDLRELLQQERASASPSQSAIGARETDSGALDVIVDSDVSAGIVVPDMARLAAERHASTLLVVHVLESEVLVWAWSEHPARRSAVLRAAGLRQVETVALDWMHQERRGRPNRVGPRHRLEAPEQRESWVTLRLAGAGSLALAPSPTLGAALSAGLRARRWSMTVEGYLDVAGGHARLDGDRGSVRALPAYGALTPCYHVSLIGFCGVLAIGVLRSSSQAIVDTAEAAPVFAAMGARAEATLAIGGHLAVFFSISGLGVLTPVSLQVDAEPVWETQWLAAVAQLGMEARLPW